MDAKVTKLAQKLRIVKYLYCILIFSRLSREDSICIRFPFYLLRIINSMKAIKLAYDYCTSTRLNAS